MPLPSEITPETIAAAASAFFTGGQFFISWLQYKLTGIQNRNTDSLVDPLGGADIKDYLEAINTTQYALSETVAHLGRVRNENPLDDPEVVRSNDRIARLWREASVAIRKIDQNSAFASVAYDKHLYWLDPTIFNDDSDSEVYRITFKNIRAELNKLGMKYEKLQAKQRTTDRGRR